MDRGAEPTAGEVVLADVLRRLDAGVLLPLRGPDAAAVAVRSVAIADPADPTAEAGAVVLAPGLVVADQVPLPDALLPAAAVVVRGGAEEPGVPSAAGPAVLGIDPAMPWDRAFLLLSAALDSALAEAAQPGGAGAAERLGDLFGLADAVAGAVGGSVLVLDAQNRVLAFSGGDQPTDEWRRDTILGRQVPDQWQRRFRAEGIYERLRRPGEVVGFTLDEPGFRPRRAVGVHAGGRALGLIAAAEGEQPFDDRTDEVLREAGRMAAIHLLRHASRHALGVHRQDERLRALLAGGPEPGSAVARLGLPADRPFAVAAVAVRGREGGGTAEGVGRTLQMRLPAGLASAVVPDGTRVYLLLAGAADRLEAAAEDDGWLRGHPHLVAGLSRPVERPEDIPAAREEADRVADTLVAGTVARSVASPAQTWPVLALAQAEQVVRTPDALRYGRAAVLVEHDRVHGTDYAPTLQAFLRLRGDSTGTADALHIHPNTLRYRVRRACEIAGIDLDDPTGRLVLELQLSALTR